MNEALTASEITIAGHDGDEIPAYVARPLEADQFGSVVVIHHMPGYDSATKEIARKFAAYGYAAIIPHLHHRHAPGASPDDAAAASRADGGVPDERLVGDVSSAMDYLRALEGSNGKVGVIGYCSGGRQAFLAACSIPQLAAAVDCYGACVVNAPPEGFPVKIKPVVGLAEDLACPLLGLFGEDDKFPAPDETAELSRILDGLGKEHEFHTYAGAGHAFFSVNRPSYRVEAANDGWDKIWDFFGRYLAS
jgi:carboxymethylenebutenolidase